MRAWIEVTPTPVTSAYTGVALYMRAWIEV